MSGPVFAGALAAISGCGPSVQATGPGTTPTKDPATVDKPADPARPERALLGPGHHIVVGEVCLAGTGGGPQLAPLLIRGAQWTDEPSEVSDWIEHGTGSRFEVFDVEGGRAGLFDTMAAADGGPLPQSVATGSYTGAPPCTRPVGRAGNREEEPKCTLATGGCGLGVADLEVSATNDMHVITPDAVGGACADATHVVVDVDGDGTNEVFAMPDMLDPMRAPVDEWVAGTDPAPACKPTFTTYGISVNTGDTSKPADPRYVVGIDVLAVADLDGDGRRELVLALRYPERRSIVVYTATQTPTRLELAGEATAWTR